MITYNLERDHWDKERTRENARIKTMTDAQHRAVSLLAMYTHRAYINKERIEGNDYIARRIYLDFFTNTVSIMLHAAGLPEIGLSTENYSTEGINCVIEKARKYLCYIDKKYGTWYSPFEYRYVA